MQNWIPLSASLIAAGVVACSSTDDPGNGGAGAGGSGAASATGGSGGSTGGAGGSAPLTCDTDYDRIAADTTPVSFQADVMPILSRACTQSDCHCNRDTNPRCKAVPQANLFLGAGVSTGVTIAEVADAVHANLVGVPSETAPAALRVAANDPASSFLIQKISDTHDEQGHECTPQDSSVTGCGDPMPPGGPTVTLCTQETSGQTEFDLIARWVAQGAPNN